MAKVYRSGRDRADRLKSTQDFTRYLQQEVGEMANQCTIKASCPTCGPMEYAPSGLHVTIWTNSDAHAEPRATYEFFCLRCREEISMETTKEIVETLVLAGVRVTVLSVPAEVDERRSMAHPPLTEDDLLNFIIDLGQALDRRLGWPELSDPG